MATPDEMNDDQTLMDSMPASREFVLPEERKMYRGFKMPAGMSTEQEMRYKAAIDEREDFASKAARQLPRIADDVRESIRGVGRSAMDVGKAAGDLMTDAALTVPRAKAAMYTDPEGSAEFARSVVAGDREARKQLATGASESMVEPAATMGDIAMAKYAAEEGRFGEAGMYGAAVLLPYVSAGMLKKLRMGGEMAAESLSKPAREAAEQLNTLEADLAAGRISKADAKVRGAEIEEQYMANELSDAIDADDFATSSKILDDAYIPPVKADYISPRDMGTLEEFLGRQGKDISQVSKQGLLDIRNSKAFQDFELEDVRRSNEFAEAIDAEDFNRTSAMLRGGTPGGGGGGRYRYPNLMNDLRSDLSNTDGGPLVDQNQARATMDRLFEIDQNEKRIRNTGKNAFGEVVDNPESELRRLDDQRIKVAEEYYNNKAVRLDKIRAGGGGGAARSATDANIFAGQRQGSYSGDDRRMFDYLIDEPDRRIREEMDYVEDLFKQGKLSKDEALSEYRIIAKAKQFDDYVDPDAYPNFSRPQTMYDRAKAGGTPGGGTPTKSYGEREALRKNLLDRKIERSRLRSRRHEEDYNRVFGEDPPKGLRGPTDEQYSRMKDNFFASVTQRRPTVEQMDELQAQARRLGLSSVDELLDLQDDFLKNMPYTYQEKKALTPDQLDEIEGQARRLGLSDSDEYLELIKDFNRTSADPVKATKPVKQKYYLVDPRTGKTIRTKSGKLKEFNSPDEASEYADEVLDNFTLGIRDLDGNIPKGWR